MKEKNKGKKVTERKTTLPKLTDLFKIFESMVQSNDYKYMAVTLTTSQQLLCNGKITCVNGSMERSRSSQ